MDGRVGFARCARNGRARGRHDVDGHRDPTSRRSTGEEAKAVREQSEAVKDQAVAAREEVALSRAALEASRRPVLVSVPLGLYASDTGDSIMRIRTDPGAIAFYQSEDRLTLSVPLRNAGDGLAFVRGIDIVWPRPDEVPGFWIGSASVTVIAPGELTAITNSTALESEELARSALERLQTIGVFSIEARYSDIAGAQETITRVDVQRPDTDPSWRVTRTRLFRPGEAEPFASSGSST